MESFCGARRIESRVGGVHLGEGHFDTSLLPEAAIDEYQ
jgi:hypothetical protein